MKPRRVWAVARKEFLHVLRDPRSFGLAIGLPVMLLVLFGYALTLDVDNVPLVVWDQGGTALSRDYIARFTGSRYFSLRGYADNYAQIERAIDTRTALVALVVPTDFSENLAAHRTARAQLILDGSDSNTASLALGYAEIVNQTFNRDVALEQVGPITAGTGAGPLDIRPRVWYNPDLESKNFIFPGLIAVIMMIIAALLTSLTVAREWETGTMEQLISTPVKGRELVLGKLIPYFIIGMLDIVLAVLLGQFVFRVPLRGSPVLLFSIAAVFLPGVLSLGIFVSVVTRNQTLASQITIILTFIPSFLLSGFVFPISSMPRVIQIITYFIPARYLITVLKGIYLKGVGLRVLGFETLLLAGFGVLMVILALVGFRKKLE